MKKEAKVFKSDVYCGELHQLEDETFVFTYTPGYNSNPISLTMPTSQQTYNFDSFPPFFDGLLPEGIQLEALLKNQKIDRHDYFSQLIAVGQDLVGDVTVQPQ